MSCTSTFKQNLEFPVMKKITNDIPTSSIPVQAIKLSSGLTLADQEYYKSNKVDMLIGTKKSKKIVTKPKSNNTVRTLDDVDAEEEDQTDNLRPRIWLRKTDMDTVRPEYCRPE
ncbi:hypothetical protein ACI65C_006048 [Semiaphis heraclei]